MEKHAHPKPKNNNNSILKYLPRAASAFNFQNPPYSPSRDKRTDKVRAHAAGKGFSGPIISMIPDEIRMKPKNKNYEAQEEPTSPKISCMGQIKQKKKMCKANKLVSPPQENKPVPSPRDRVKKQGSKIKKLFGGSKPGRRSDASSNDDRSPVPGNDYKAPSISQMKRFASGREGSLANFDWTAQITPTDHRDWYSDDDGGFSDPEDDEVIIPFSAPIPVGGGGGGAVSLQPRKEVNLWKRRTMNPPRRLQLNSMV